MEPSWKNGKGKKEMLEKAKRLIDHVLSKGYSMTNRDLYRCIEVGIGFSPISIPNPTHMDKINYEYALKKVKRDLVSESMRWIKKQIILRNLRLEDYLEETKTGKQWRYRYIVPHFSVFSGTPVKRDSSNSLKLALYNLTQRHKSNKNICVTIHDNPIDYNSIITNYNNRHEQLKRLRDKEIDEAFDLNISLIQALREIGNEDANNRIAKIIEEGITFFEENEDKSYVLGYLYVATMSYVFDNIKKSHYANKYLDIIKNSTDKDLKDEYVIYTALIYYELGTYIVEDKIEVKESYLRKALEILEMEDKKDIDIIWAIVKVYSGYSYIYSWGVKPKESIEYGVKVLQMVDEYRIPAYNEVAKVIFDMYITYWNELNDDIAAEEILREGVERLSNVEPEYKENAEIWLDLFERSINSVMKLREDHSSI